MSNIEREITTTISGGSGEHVTVVSEDKEKRMRRNGGTTIIRKYETTGENPTEARDMAIRQEKNAMWQAVAAGLATTGEVLSGGAFVANGLLTRDAMTVLAGLGLMGAGYETGKKTFHADRKSTIYKNVGDTLTNKYELPTAPSKGVNMRKSR